MGKKEKLREMLMSVCMEHLEPVLLKVMENATEQSDLSEDMAFRRIKHAQDSIYEIVNNKLDAAETEELMNNVYLLGNGYRDLFFEIGFLIGEERY